MRFPEGVCIVETASVVGKKEGEGPMGQWFDEIEQDPMFGQKNWDEAESELQKRTVELVMKKASVDRKRIRYLFAGDLLGQLIATSFGVSGFDIPLFGLYGACSTMGESMALGAMTVAAGYGDSVLCMTSSHFASAEKQFRFPLEYGNQRPLSATWTVTGSGACILGPTPPAPKKSAHASSSESTDGSVKITGITTGRLVDYGCRDSLNMGACMAPADVL